MYSWVEGRGKDGEFKSLLILEDCIFLLEVYLEGKSPADR
jgi:hypothetical protein